VGACACCCVCLCVRGRACLYLSVFIYILIILAYVNVQAQLPPIPETATSMPQTAPRGGPLSRVPFSLFHPRSLARSLYFLFPFPLPFLSLSLSLFSFSLSIAASLLHTYTAQERGSREYQPQGRHTTHILRITHSLQSKHGCRRIKCSHNRYNRISA
jgi:hypothetical protein